MEQKQRPVTEFLKSCCQCLLGPTNMLAERQNEKDIHYVYCLVPNDSDPTPQLTRTRKMQLEIASVVAMTQVTLANEI